MLCCRLFVKCYNALVSIVYFSASHTTRLPSHDETPGKDYHFVSLDDFENGIKMVTFLTA